jgi:tetratricopeptide (TPR) repeat protein
VRTFFISSLFLAFLAVAATTGAAGEVIHLKNGRVIWADHVREDADHVQYDVGDDTYAIPKSLVERIETGGAPPTHAPSAGVTQAVRDLPVLVPVDSLPPDSALMNKIIIGGSVDEDALAALEKTGDARTVAAGYFLAGKHDLERENFPGAHKYLDTALRFDGQNPTILNYYAALLLRTGNASEALSYAERAVSAAPNSPDTLTVLGYAQYASDHEQDAIRTWKRSLELRPDANVKLLLAKAERDSAVQTNYSEHESNHFTLHYEGEKTADSLREEMLVTLEADYDDLSRQFGSGPRSSIPVVLYTGQAFFDVTQAPSWTGAVNDGKLRIPVRGLTSITPELAHVLKHELAHSFINQLSAGRCPQWLNEGLAQAAEPKKLSDGSRLAQLFQAQQEIPLNALEGNFMRFSGAEATLAYDESLAAVQYIQDTYGMSDLQRVLETLSEGSSTEAALRATIHSDYAQLEAETGKYLISKYGR